MAWNRRTRALPGNTAGRLPVVFPVTSTILNPNSDETVRSDDVQQLTRTGPDAVNFAEMPVQRTRAQRSAHGGRVGLERCSSVTGLTHGTLEESICYKKSEKAAML